MANRKVTMTDLRVIVREFARGTSLRKMERKLGVSRTSLRPYRERALESGKTMQELLQLEDAELYRLLCKGDGHRSRDTERYAFMQKHIEEYAHKMTRKYMTFEVLYSDHYCPQTDNPYGYTQFKAIIQESVDYYILKILTTIIFMMASVRRKILSIKHFDYDANMVS